LRVSPADLVEQLPVGLLDRLERLGCKWGRVAELRANVGQVGTRHQTDATSVGRERVAQGRQRLDDLAHDERAFARRSPLVERPAQQWHDGPAALSPN